MSVATTKVIVVGGGPVGMTAAHALSKAGIDFVLLESRPTIVMDAGSNLVLSPTGLRALGQLGMLPALNSVSSPLAKFSRFDHKGRDIGDTMFFTYFQQNHGGYPRVISRHDLMQTLWDALPAETRSKLHTSKKVSDIRTTEAGVVVQCTDGALYEGSVVIGADGAHSVVRKHMRSMASASEGQPHGPAVAQNDEVESFLTSYRCFWMRFPVLPGITPGDASESHGPVATTQFFAGEETAVVGVYEKLEQPTREPPRRYTAEDEAAFVAKWRHLPLVEGGGITLGDAHAVQLQSGLVNLEEGVVRRWSHGGRVVLVGDAAHKFTPSTGAGCNNGIVDVVVLANTLYRVFSAAAAASARGGGDGGEPSRDSLGAAFAEYQRRREGTVAANCRLSGQATAMATWSSFLFKFLDLYIFSSTWVQQFFVNRNADAIARSPVFSYIEGREELLGRVPWAHPIPSAQKQSVSSG